MRPSSTTSRTERSTLGVAFCSSRATGRAVSRRTDRAVRCRRVRRGRAKTTGTRMIAVMMPTCSSRCSNTVRASVSATTRNRAPNTTGSDSSRRWYGPLKSTSRSPVRRPHGARLPATGAAPGTLTHQHPHGHGGHNQKRSSTLHRNLTAHIPPRSSRESAVLAPSAMRKGPKVHFRGLEGGGETRNRGGPAAQIGVARPVRANRRSGSSLGPSCFGWTRADTGCGCHGCRAARHRGEGQGDLRGIALERPGGHPDERLGAGLGQER
jgi:hypothetical protein